MATHTVVKGDSLPEIAAFYGTTVSALVDLNDITDKNYIVIGQVLNLDGAAATKKKTTSSKVTIKAFGLQSNSDNTLYITWNWTKSHTDNYRIIWYYATGDGVWFVGSDSTVEYKQATYSIPSNATKVKVKIKPISTKHKVNGKEKSYWTGSWSKEKVYNVSSSSPKDLSKPSDVKIEDLKLTVRLDDLDTSDLRATHVQFKIARDDKNVIHTSKVVAIKTNSVSYSYKVTSGHSYKVSVRGYSSKNKDYGDWSEYSDSKNTPPDKPLGFTTMKTTSKSSVYLKWKAVTTADTYDIQYATDKSSFSRNSDDVTDKTGIELTKVEITGLEGDEYFFRIRAVNDAGESAWSDVSNITVGKEPAAPTTWSSTTTAITGEEVYLYWVHNSEDGSSQTYAAIDLTIDGDAIPTLTQKNTTDEDEQDKTSVYPIDTSPYSEGTTIEWRVKTAGALTDSNDDPIYGEWSVPRKIDVYAEPTLDLSVTNASGESVETFESFPIYISAEAGPSTQTPIGYHLTVTANEGYETIDQIGNEKVVSAGEEVYSKYFDISENLSVALSAGDIDLENNITYTITCVVSMNSGLTKEETAEFTISWTDEEYEPNAEIGIDDETLSASIRPYCEDGDEVLVEDITLSVYRREYDGSFTEIMSGIDNTGDTWIVDPHPALDYARYRIVAISNTTGSVSYYDMPGEPVGEKAAIIQWDEEWSYTSFTNEDEFEEPLWSGQMIKLPYNIDVSDKHSSDVSLVEYIGRKRPVSYYGTQLGETSTWNVDIDKKDTETLYMLRKLAIWMGDVYVREPSGSGYWANISVSFSQKHCELVIPVTFDIKRVEGGV